MLSRAAELIPSLTSCVAIERMPENIEIQHGGSSKYLKSAYGQGSHMHSPKACLSQWGNVFKQHAWL